jgi:hypothetical protein
MCQTGLSFANHTVCKPSPFKLLIDMASTIDITESKVIDNIHLESAKRSTLSPEHEAYLVQRHGTTNLTPLPSTDPNDPLNWPTWRKNTQILMVAFHAMMTTFTAAALLPAFIPFAELYKVSVTSASYLTSVQVSGSAFIAAFS